MFHYLCQPKALFSILQLTANKNSITSTRACDHWCSSVAGLIALLPRMIAHWSWITYFCLFLLSEKVCSELCYDPRRTIWTELSSRANASSYSMISTQWSTTSSTFLCCTVYITLQSIRQTNEQRFIRFLVIKILALFCIHIY